MPLVLSGQDEDKMRVERVDAVDQSKPVYNIHVDNENKKWIANSEVVYLVEAKDQATPIRIPAGQQSLLQLPGGDFDLRWDIRQMREILGEARVTAAAYQRRSKTLWIGTDGYGVYKILVDNGLKLQEEIYIDNSKLRSDFINSIYVTPDNTVWIGTEDGALQYKDGNTSMFQKFFNIQTISGTRRETWATGDNIIWIIDNRDNWEPIEVNTREIEGEIHDIALGQDGKIWIASNIMTSYNPTTRIYQRFGPGQYFTSQFVNYVSVDQDGTIWVGSDDKGVYIIEKESTITVIASVDQALDCSGTMSDAMISARVVGGEGPYTFAWSTGAASERVLNVPAGLYQVTATDANGNSKSAAIEIPNPAISVAVLEIQQESGDGSSDAVAEVSIEGGVPDYRVAWSNGMQGPRLESLSAGTYTITVTDDAGCTATVETTIGKAVRELTAAIQVTRPYGCVSDAGASVQAEVAGGQAPYTYFWSDNDETLSNEATLPGGSFVVMVTDALGNTATASVEITEPEPFTANTVIEQTASSNTDDGQAFVEVEGGAPPYSYLWSTGEMNEMAITLGAFEHTVTVTDVNGCTAVAAVTMTEELLPLNVSLTQESEILCPGESTATLNIEVSGGRAPFSFAWSDNIPGAESLNALGTGIYSVTVTDGTGTTAHFETEIVEPVAMNINLVETTTATLGTADGTVRVGVTGGNGPYTYVWANGATADAVDGLAAGDYQVTVTDANGCSITSVVSVSEEVLPLTAVLTQNSEVLCASDATGSLTAEPSGGRGEYTYAWSTGETTQTIENLTAGIYDLTITTTGESSIFHREIIAPEPLVANGIVVRNASTDNADGAASIEVQGGVESYAYAWADGATASSTETLAPGTHEVTVTDGNGCTVIAAFEIGEDILPLAVSLNEGSPILCAGATTATLTPEITGGKGPFTYAWSDASALSLLEGVGAGMHSITITDSEGTTAVFEREVTEPSAVLVNAIVEASASTGNSDGKATLDISGGTGPYTYAWDNGETELSAVALAPGDHTVTVTDVNGCSAETTMQISENILPLMVVIEQSEKITCHGDASGRVTANVTGGKGPFSYSWTTVDGNNANNAEAATVDNIAAGNISLEVTDALGNTAAFTLEIAQPEEFIVNVLATASASANNADGQASVEASGGIGPYTYAWDTDETDAAATTLAAGVHTVTVTDAAGCMAVGDIEITEDILPITIGISEMVELLCAGDLNGLLAIEVEGGKAPFTYAWSTGSESTTLADLGPGTYTVTVTDVNGTSRESSFTLEAPEALSVDGIVTAPASANGSDGQAELTISGGSEPYSIAWADGSTAVTNASLAEGEHTAVVTDANGCSASATVTIDENILPLSVNVERDVSGVLCNGDATGIIKAVPNGGKGPFTYTWSDGGNLSSERNDLSAGVYTLTVTDVTGAKATAEVPISEPPVLTVVIEHVSSASTNGTDGRAEAIATGGVTPYSFAWDNGETDARAFALDPGTHTIIVTDVNGCAASAAIDITEEILPLQVVVQQSAGVNCSGGSTGAVASSVSGGKAPFTYAWSNGGTGESLQNLAAGTFGVTVTDAAGQTSAAELELVDPSPLQAEVVDVRAAAAEHVPDGRAKIEVSGGAGNYTFTWDNNETGQSAQNLGIGNHSVTVSDANGCSLSLNFEVTKKILPTLTAEALQSGQAVRMEQLQFEADSSNINKGSVPTLTELYQFLYDNPTIVVEIGGHTNGLPEHDYCDALSSARAKAVATWIVQQGIDEKRVYYKGYGKRKPIATNRSPEGRRKNQRVEVRILALADDN